MTQPEDTITLSKEEAELLRSYRNGRRIWDAASVYAVVLKLEAKGLVTPVGDSGAYELTEAGRTQDARLSA